MTVLAAFLQLALKRLPIRKAVGNLLTGLCLLLFLALSGFQPSASRGAAMYGVLLLADSTGRRSDGLNSLGLAVLAVCLGNPFAGGDLGFALSVTATLGIVLLYRPLEQAFLGKRRQGLALCPVEAGGGFPGGNGGRLAGDLPGAAGGVWGIPPAAAFGQLPHGGPRHGLAVPGFRRFLSDAAPWGGVVGGSLCVGGRVAFPAAPLDGPGPLPGEGRLFVPLRQRAAGGRGAAGAADSLGPGGPGPSPAEAAGRVHGGFGGVRRGVPGVAG